MGYLFNIKKWCSQVKSLMNTKYGRSEGTRFAPPLRRLGRSRSQQSTGLLLCTARPSSPISQKKNLPIPDGIRRFLVGVKGLEPPASWSQTRRATNCATPRYNIIVILKWIDWLACYQLSVRNIVASLAWSASRCSVFLPAQVLPSSATGGGKP